MSALSRAALPMRGRPAGAGRRCSLPCLQPRRSQPAWVGLAHLRAPISTPAGAGSIRLLAHPGLSRHGRVGRAAGARGPAPARRDASNPQHAPARARAGGRRGALRSQCSPVPRAPPPRAARPCPTPPAARHPAPALAPQVSRQQAEIVAQKKIKVAINGFGRIGRNFLRCWEGRENSLLDVVSPPPPGGCGQARSPPLPPPAAAAARGNALHGGNARAARRARHCLGPEGRCMRRRAAPVRASPFCPAALPGALALRQAASHCHRKGAQRRVWRASCGNAAGGGRKPAPATPCALRLAATRPPDPPAPRLRPPPPADRHQRLRRSQAGRSPAEVRLHPGHLRR
jgi:hypothetical protein